MSLPDIDITKIAADLVGTCKDLSETLPDGVAQDDLTQTQLAELDEHVMCCTACGWWSDADEFNGEQECEECQK